MSLDLPPTETARRRKRATRHVARAPRIAGRDVRLPYLPGLDGLRAFAVTAVLLYHAQFGSFPGGFLGVEIFFVISGYLITSLLLTEWREWGRVDLAGFWLRRARRLLPALYLVLAVTLAFAVAFLPGEVAGLRDDALAAIGYVTNWYLVFNHESYFETVGRPSLLQHLWSLAVEEQFYVLWPLLFAGGMALVRWPLRRVLLVALLVGAAASALLMAFLYQPNVDPSRIYYGTDTRASGLLIGAALAFVWPPGRSPGRSSMGQPTQGRVGRIMPTLLDALGLAALGGLVLFCLFVDQYEPFLYQGGFVVVSLLTAVAISVAVDPRAYLMGAGLLGRQPLRWIGLRSYGIYLWHWPVFMVTRPDLDVPIQGLPLFVLRMAATVAIADLSYRLVETPIRKGALGRAWRKLREAQGVRRWRLATRWAGAIAMGTAFIATLGVAVALAKPPAPPSYLSVQEVHTESPSAAPETGAQTPTSTTTPDNIAAKDETAPAETSSPAETAPSSDASSGTPVRAPAGGVNAVGDSVMVGASGELAKSIDGVSIDAAVGLQAAGAIEILQNRRDAGTLGDTVIVHVGTNGVFTEEQFDELMDILKDVRKVVFVNVKAPRFWEEPNNDMIAAGVSRYPKNAVLVDWHAASANRPELFVEDGIHLQPDGQRLYADLISSQIGS